jgi:hypothetical protein
MSTQPERKETVETLSDRQEITVDTQAENAKGQEAGPIAPKRRVVEQQVKKQRTEERLLTFTLLIAFIITVGGAVLLANLIEDPETSPGNFYFEVARYLLQLGIVIIIGGLVAYFFREEGERRRQEREDERYERDLALKEAEKRQEQAQARAAIRVDYLNRLGSAYRNVKAARRALRAGGMTSRYDDYQPATITDNLAQVYRDEMKRVNDAQLVLEALKIEADSLPAFVALSDVKDKLETMEDYLRDVLWEYEKASALRESGKPVVFGDLEKLEEFTGATKRTLAPERHRFKAHFSAPYDMVVKAISKQLH